jgi:hypothetical protein
MEIIFEKLLYHQTVFQKLSNYIKEINFSIVYCATREQNRCFPTGARLTPERSEGGNSHSSANTCAPVMHTIFFHTLSAKLVLFCSRHWGRKMVFSLPREQNGYFAPSRIFCSLGRESAILLQKYREQNSILHPECENSILCIKGENFDFRRVWSL